MIRLCSCRILLAAGALLALLAFPSRRASAMAPASRVPAAIVQLRGRTADANHTYQAGEPAVIAVGVDPGFDRNAPRSATLKTLFEPGDITLTLPAPAGHFDPVQAALDRYRKSHPNAVCLPAPAEASITSQSTIAPIPVRAVFAADASPDAPRQTIDCGLIDVPALYAKPGEITVSVALAAAAIHYGGPAAFGGVNGRFTFVVADEKALLVYEAHLSVTRPSAQLMLDAEARKALGPQAAVSQPLCLVSLQGDPAGAHYEASYVTPQGKTLDLKLFAAGLPTVSLNGNAAQWPALPPAPRN